MKLKNNLQQELHMMFSSIGTHILGILLYPDDTFYLHKLQIRMIVQLFSCCGTCTSFRMSVFAAQLCEEHPTHLTTVWFQTGVCVHV